MWERGRWGQRARIWKRRVERTGIGEEEHRNGWLFKGEQETDVRVEGGEYDVPRMDGGVIVDFGKDGIDKGVEFNGISVHFLLFGFVKHGVLYNSRCQLQLKCTYTTSTYSSRH